MKAHRRQRLFLVDDHMAILVGLTEHLEGTNQWRVCGTASSQAEAMRGILQNRPALALIDLRLATGSGIELIKQLRAWRLSLPLLAYSGFAEPDLVHAAVAAGANGYLVKTDWAALEPALRALLAGGTFFSPSVARHLATPPPQLPATARKLSRRESQVFALAGQGLDSKQIADRLALSAKTVYDYFKRIRAKLVLADHKALLYAAFQAMHRPVPE